MFDILFLFLAWVFTSVKKKSQILDTLKISEGLAWSSVANEQAELWLHP